MTKKTNKKILIIEDDLPTLEAVIFKLSQLGIAAAVAKNGEEALEKLKKEKYDLVLVDLLLPKKSGFEVIKDIKSNGYSKDAKVIVFSNLDRKENIALAAKLGVVSYFVKSDTTINELAKKIIKELKTNN